MTIADLTELIIEIICKIKDFFINENNRTRNINMAIG